MKAGIIKVVVGVALIALGVFFLVDSLTDFSFPLSTWWPLFLIAFALYLLTQGAHVQATIAGGVALLILLSNLNIVTIDLWALWPVLLIAIGACILFRRSRRGKRGKAAAGADLNVSCVFSEASHRIDSPQFRGGKVGALFGSADVDLRGAVLAEGAATIKADALFGSIKLQVPPDWAVDVRASATLGDVAAKRPAPADAEATLTVTGSCLFGGIEITS